MYQQALKRAQNSAFPTVFHLMKVIYTAHFGQQNLRRNIEESVAQIKGANVQAEKILGKPKAVVNWWGSYLLAALCMKDKIQDWDQRLEKSFRVWSLPLPNIFLENYQQPIHTENAHATWYCQVITKQFQGCDGLKKYRCHWLPLIEVEEQKELCFFVVVCLGFFVCLVFAIVTIAEAIPKVNSQIF